MAPSAHLDGSASDGVSAASSPRRYMKHKRDDGVEKQDEETVDVTPIMICVFVVMCCNMLVLLYFFYDYLGKKADTPQRRGFRLRFKNLAALLASLQILAARRSALTFWLLLCLQLSG